MPELAIIAIEDDTEAEAAAARLKARGVLINAVDRPRLCDFTLPAIVDRSPVIIAIGTGGASASLAKALRQWLERMLPASLGRVAEALKAAKPRLAGRFPQADERRAFLDGLLSPGGSLDPLADHAAPAQLVADALDDGVEPLAHGFDVVELKSADPDDLTLRAARLLSAADTVCYRPDVPAAIIDRARADAHRIPAMHPPAGLPAGRTVFLKMAEGE